MRRSFVASVVVIVVLMVLLAGFVLYFVSSMGTISSLKSSVSFQQGVMTEQSSSLQSQSSRIGILISNATAYEQLVASLRQAIATDQGAISTLQTKLSQDNATIVSLNSQIHLANEMMANLTTTVNLQASKVLVKGQSVTIYGTASTSTPFLTFNTPHAGYLLIEVSSATVSYLVDAAFTPSGNNPSTATFESMTGLSPGSPGVAYYIIPLVPGVSDSFALVSSSASDGTATLTTTYFY